MKLYKPCGVLETEATSREQQSGALNDITKGVFFVVVRQRGAIRSIKSNRGGSKFEEKASMHEGQSELQKSVRRPCDAKTHVV